MDGSSSGNRAGSGPQAQSQGDDQPAHLCSLPQGRNMVMVMVVMDCFPVKWSLFKAVICSGYQPEGHWSGIWLPSAPAKWPDPGYSRGTNSHRQFHGQVQPEHWPEKSWWYIYELDEVSNTTTTLSWRSCPTPDLIWAKAVKIIAGVLLMTAFHPSSFTHTRDMSRWHSFGRSFEIESIKRFYI